MVKYRVLFTADLQNLTNLQPAGGVANPTFGYYFKMKCGNCGELAKKEISMISNEKVRVKLPGSQNARNGPNLVMKCKFCGRVGTVNVTTNIGKPLTEELSLIGESAPLMQLECKGFDPVELVFGNGWKANSIAGTKFEDIDLSDGEFAEYDEKGECPVAIYNLRVTFDVMMSEMRENRLAWTLQFLEWQRKDSARLKARKKETGSC